MVIDDLNIRRSDVAVWPSETKTPTFVDPNTELSFAVALKGFKVITGQPHESKRVICTLKNAKPLFSLPPKWLKLQHPFAPIKPFRRFVSEAQDHHEL